MMSMTTYIMKINQGPFMDMPKLGCPFVRREINGEYLVTSEIDPEYQWVFDEPAVKAVEKLDGTNVSVVIEGGEVKKIYNRTNEIGFWSGSEIVSALLNSLERKWWRMADGQHFGEAVGGKIQANPLGLTEKLWMPFELAESRLMYTSFYKHERTFENWSEWFEKYLFSLMAQKYQGKDKVMAEGVVFYHPDGVRMAKLRRDMFPWYEGRRHEDI